MINKLTSEIKILKVCSDDYLDQQDQRISPDWEIWEHAPRTRLIDAVALSCEICPSDIDLFDFDINTKTYPSSFFHIVSIELTRRLAIAEANFHTVDFGSEPSIKYPRFREISTYKFFDWATQKGWEIPEKFPHESNVKNHRSEINYPWGSHKTDLLTKLSEAALKFWSRYDPSDPSTAPTNEQVRKWLIEQGVSSRNAAVIATILRADGLPMGKRK